MLTANAQVPGGAVPEAGGGPGLQQPRSWRRQRPLFALTPTAPPPTAAALAASAPGLGIPAVVPVVPYYSVPSDAPSRATAAATAAGVGVAVVTADPAALPWFSEPAAARKAAAWGRARGRRRVALTPAATPPSPAAVDAWLAAEVARDAGRRAGRRGVPAAASSHLAADANTGALLVVGGDDAGDALMAGLEGLVGTPVVGTPRTDGVPAGRGQAAGQPRRAGEWWPAAPGRRAPPPPPAAPPPPAVLPSQRPTRPARPSRLPQGGEAGAGGLAAPPSRRSRLSQAGWSEDVGEEGGGERDGGGDPPLPPDRPASPKYDERSFFYSTPALTGGGGSGGATRQHGSARDHHRRLGGGEATAAPPARLTPQTGPSSSTGANPPTPARFDRGGLVGGPQHVSLLAVEVHAASRPASAAAGARSTRLLLPDPAVDPILCVVLVGTDDGVHPPPGWRYPARALMLSQQQAGQKTSSSVLDPDGLASLGIAPSHFPTEASLLEGVVRAIASADPDFLVGWDVQGPSLGMLAARAAVVFPPGHPGSAFLLAISRTPGEAARAASAAAAATGTASAAGLPPPIPPHLRPPDAFAAASVSAGLAIPGRSALNAWRVMRTELKLTSYTLPACVAAVLRVRAPQVGHETLARWWDGWSGGVGGGGGGGNRPPSTPPTPHLTRWRTVAALARRARLTLALLDALDVVGRAAEMARTYGIDAASVLTRGSQYRVEAVMARLAHVHNFLLPSPARAAVAGQPAMECLPLVMEPESRIHAHPVAVLDFQSLYPSMVIAYNLCFSTLVGRAEHVASGAAREACARGEGAGVPPADASSPAPTPAAPVGGGGGGEGARLGVGRLAVPPSALAGPASPASLTIPPNGVAFVPAAVRAGVLPRMLDDILAARVMVKGGMARAPPGDAPLRRSLNARQFGLKLLANVTYGYTAAGFSGRMPCAELADSIVQSGRATLEAAMGMVEAPGAPWAPARVVYGDTDSLFISFPGRSPAAAWDAAAAIAVAVTAANPPPVALKLEKVYDGCALLAKKRYAGLAHTARPPDAWGGVPRGLPPPPSLPAFDAKGIETVRRDTCPAVAKVLEATLRLLLGRRDLSEVRAAVAAACGAILGGRVRLADLVFAKEVRLGTYRGALPPPAALVAARAVAADPRAAPRLGERVPYVVVCGPPGARLADLVVSPAALLEPHCGGGSAASPASARLRPNGAYYVAKCVLPALDRVLALVGADCKAWVSAMPRPPAPPAPHKRVVVRGGGAGGSTAPPTIASFCLSRHCASCDGLTRPDAALCAGCAGNPQAAAAAMAARLAGLDRRVGALRALCVACGGGGGWGGAGGDIACTSLDCGAYYERRKAGVERAAAAGLAETGLRELV